MQRKKMYVPFLEMNLMPVWAGMFWRVMKVNLHLYICAHITNFKAIETHVEKQQKTMNPLSKLYANNRIYNSILCIEFDMKRSFAMHMAYNMVTQQMFSHHNFQFLS